MRNVLKKSKKALIFASIPLVAAIIVLCITGHVGVLKTTLYSLGILLLSAYTIYKEPQLFLGKRR